MFRYPLPRRRFELGLISNLVGYVTAERTRVTRLANLWRVGGADTTRRST
jgi:hypothetical protein